MARLLIAVIALASVVYTTLGGNAFAAVSSEKRVALVIGNSDYKNPSLSLPNPKNDAADMADALKELDFQVQLVTNVGKRDLDGVLERFARLAATADSALFYYAGHAIQFQGKNFIMPVDAELEDEISIRYNLVSIDEAKSALDRASGVKIMVLDACRNNPIADRLNRQMAGGASRSAGMTRGLARIDKTQGMVIAYATAADDVAYDGKNTRNSPFTSALVKFMREPGLEIGLLFRRVAASVDQETGGKQRPETSISLLNEYYLNQNDRRIWNEMRNSTDIAEIREFIRKYPNSPSAIDAKYRLDALERAQREREDEALRVQREAYQREFAQREAAARQEIARLEDERRRAEQDASRLDDERRKQEAAKLAALEDQRRKDAEAAAQKVARQQREEREERERIAKIESDRQEAERLLREKREVEQRKQAAEKLAALEQERVKAEQEAAQREAVRRREDDARRQKEEACAKEKSALDALNSSTLSESDLTGFIAKSTCESEKFRAQSTLASLRSERERFDRACDSEEKQLNVLRQAGAAGRPKLIELQKSLICTRLETPVAAAIDKANVEARRALVRGFQAELRRVGCYRGAENGDLNEPTKEGLKKVNAKLGNANEVPELSDELLTSVKGVEGLVCQPPKIEERPRVVAPPPRMRPAPATRHADRAPREAAPAPAPAARQTAGEGGGAAPSSGGTRIQGLSF